MGTAIPLVRPNPLRGARKVHFKQRLRRSSSLSPVLLSPVAVPAGKNKPLRGSLIRFCRLSLSALGVMPYKLGEKVLSGLPSYSSVVCALTKLSM